MDLTATYSPEDNKLRLYSSSRLDSETYSELNVAGFRWAPKQELFVAPMWTPEREDLLIRLCGSIEDEDKSLVQRSEERAERFDNYSERRAADADQARKRVDSIVEHNWGNGGRDFTRTIPFDKLTAIMSKAVVDSARQAGLIQHETSIGFLLPPRPILAVGEQVSAPLEEDKILPTPVVSTGIQTPRGPIIGNRNPDPSFKQSESGRNHKPGMHL